MKVVLKSCMLAVAALGAVVSPVHAASISSPTHGTPVTATGTITIDILGWIGRRTCDVVVYGTVDSSGPVDKITFTSGASTSTNCNADDHGVVEFPFSVTATSATVMTADAITLNPASGSWPCAFVNVALSWNNATSTASRSSPPVGASDCVITRASLTISPAVTISP